MLLFLSENDDVFAIDVDHCLERQLVGVRREAGKFGRKASRADHMMTTSKKRKTLAVEDRNRLYRRRDVSWCKGLATRKHSA